MVTTMNGPGTHCPTCNLSGQKVNRVTLESLLRPELLPNVGEGQYLVCTTPGCPTVYFGQDGQVFDEAGLRVPFGLKDTSRPRTVCYCFNHTVEEIHNEIARTGRSTVLESIKADMKESGCRCERTNPLGACCLATVEQVVDGRLRRHG